MKSALAKLESKAKRKRLKEEKGMAKFNKKRVKQWLSISPANKKTKWYY
jgi:hypothetical protein